MLVLVYTRTNRGAMQRAADGARGAEKANLGNGAGSMARPGEFKALMADVCMTLHRHSTRVSTMACSDMTEVVRYMYSAINTPFCRQQDHSKVTFAR